MASSLQEMTAGEYDISASQKVLRVAYNLDKYDRLPCRVYDAHGNLLQTISPAEQIAILEDWESRYGSINWRY